MSNVLFNTYPGRVASYTEVMESAEQMISNERGCGIVGASRRNYGARILLLCKEE